MLDVRIGGDAAIRSVEGGGEESFVHLLRRQLSRRHARRERARGARYLLAATWGGGSKHAV